LQLLLQCCAIAFQYGIPYLQAPEFLGILTEMRRSRSASDWTQYWPIIPAVLFLLLLRALSPILVPFVTAAVLAYILTPLVSALVARKWPRGLAVLTVMITMALIMVALVLVIVPLFSQQLRAVSGYYPSALNWARTTALPWLSAHTGMSINVDQDQWKSWLESHSDAAGQLVQEILPALTSHGLALVGFVANLVLLPVVLFYFLRDWDVMVGQIDTLLPNRLQGYVRSLAAEVDDVLGQYLRGELSVMLIMACFYSLGLLIAGLKSALPIGIVAGLLVFVPYLGVTVGVLLATLAAGLQYQSLGGLLPVWGVFLLGQLLEGFVVTPRLVGERIGLHPLAVIFALMAFGQLFGFVGVLLALPLAAITLVAVRRMRHRYQNSAWFLEPPAKS
jgi:predicted PurR-regulated permease PerM